MAQMLLENKLNITLAFANKAFNLGHVAAVVRSHMNCLKHFNVRE